MKKLSFFLATGLGSGLIPFFPGTMGSILALVIAWLFFPLAAAQYGILMIITFFVGVYTSSVAEKQLGHDAKSIVIDEIFGMWLTLAAVPIRIPTLIAGLILFRVFDVWKPWPIDKIQDLPQGWGVMADDALAGIYSWVILQGLLKLQLV